MAQGTEHTQWILELVDGMSKDIRSIADQTRVLNDKLEETEQRGERVNAIDLSAIAGSFRAINARLQEAIQPGIVFEKTMADMSAIAGVTGDALDDLGGRARRVAKDLGGDASDAVETMKLMLSQLTPELGEQPELLEKMTRNAMLLGKTMGGDTAGAAEVLTTAMNQFGVDLSDPIEAGRAMTDMMNTMAAGAKEGSAELPAIKAALAESGAAARRAGMDFSETIAAIEVLDKTASMKDSRGGVALRNVVSIMQQGRFMPKEIQDDLKAAGIDILALGDNSRSLKDRLELLKPVANDSALMTKFFGREAAGAGQALISNTEMLGDLTGKLEGTTTATDQAAIIMDTFSERMARANAWVADLGISIFNYVGNAAPFLDWGFKGIDMLADLALAQRGLSLIWSSGAITAIRTYVTALRGMTLSQGLQTIATSITTSAVWGFTAALLANPITWVVVAIGALVGALLWCWNNFEGFRGFLYGMWASVKEVFGGIETQVGIVFDAISDIVGKHFKSIADAASGVGSILKGIWEGDWDMITAGVGKVSDGVKDMFNNITEAPGAMTKMGSALVDNMRETGLKAGLAYVEGENEGRAAFRADKAAEEQEDQVYSGVPGAGRGLTAIDAVGSSPSGVTGKITGDTQGTGSGKGRETVVGSGGGVKNIAMSVTVQNRYDIAQKGRDIEEVVDAVVRRLTDQLRDAAYSL